MSSINQIKENADLAKQMIQNLKSELSTLNTEYNSMLAKELREENAKLLLAVEEAKKNLIELEIKNGIKQISIPGQSVQNMSSSSDVKPQVKEGPLKVKQEVPARESKPKKEVKAKEASVEPPVDVGRLDLRVAKVEDVQRHPDADSLYVLKINCGEEKRRTVCSGLVKYVPMEELRNRSVVLLCNLKPVKMRGITSEAMVMCASGELGVEVLIPAEGCTPGDHVHCEGYRRQPDPVMNPKKKIFETVAPDLHTNDMLQACYKGVPLTLPGKGYIVASSLKNVAVK